MYSVGVLRDTTVMAYESEGRLFLWHRGPYIDVARETDKVEGSSFEYNGKFYFYTDQCINVWDYSRELATIGWLDSVSFIAECESWMEGV